MSLTPTRPRAAAAGFAAVALAVTLGIPQIAHAGDAPGNNGTIKVHAPGQPLVNANEPQPESFCAFYLAAFNYDSNQGVTYAFFQQGGANAGTPAGTGGSFTVGPEGDGRSPLLTQADHDLPDGRYKVEVTNDDGQPPKSKVFNINCPGGSVPGGSGVGGVGQPDEDEGPGGVGGVDTGGGGLSGAPAAV